MYRLFLALFFSLVFFNTLSADDKIEIFATKIDTKDDVVTASHDVAVIYKDYYLTASKAIYDKKSGNLELFGDVRANKEETYKVLGSYARLNIKNKEREFHPFYMLADNYQVWISAEKADVYNEDVNISGGMVSSCDPNDPIWKMEFSSSKYNLDDQWLSLSHARVYIYDIPIFYTPWIAYPMDKTRRTGLLKPSLGYSGDEGVFYEQPIYIAESNWWDIELKPQLRSARGSGIYGKFRFTDSNVSQGHINLGYFNEYDKYIDKNELANSTHRGFNFKYENSDFINKWFDASLSGQSGLYADIGYMNDVDYINLASNSVYDTATATQVLSRINMFYNNDDNYYGTYFKFYQDLTKESNQDTLQQVPILHYHHYLTTFFDDHLFYNLDLQSNNIQREINMKVLQTDVNMPITFHTSLFDEFIDLSFNTNLFLEHSLFSGTDLQQTSNNWYYIEENGRTYLSAYTEDIKNNYTNGYIFRNDYSVKISSDLTKSYSDFTHVISFGTDYSFEGIEEYNGFYSQNRDICSYKLNQSLKICEFYKIADQERKLQMYFSQYFYDSVGTEFLYHKLAQSVVYSGGRSYSDLENEIDYKVTDNLSLYSNTFFNYDEKQFSKLYHQVSYNDDRFEFALSHLYNDTFLPETATYSPHTSYVTSYFEYLYDKHYSYKLLYDYDLELDITKRKEIGFLYSRRCWDFGIRYVENNRPVLQNTAAGGISNIPERYVYFTINLNPFMSSNDNPFFAYKLDDKE